MRGFEVKYRADDTLINGMIELDNLVYNGDDVGVEDKCKEWLKVNPDIYTILMCGDKVVGYINFMPLNDEAYDLIKLGKLKDCQLTTKHLMEFKTGEALKCLLTSIVIHPNYQMGSAIVWLWRGFIAKLQALNLNIESVIMDCVTDIGERCAVKYLDAKFITNSNGGKIYEGRIKDL